MSSARPGPMSGSHQSPAASAEPVRAWTTSTCGRHRRRTVVPVGDGQLGECRPVVEFERAQRDRFEPTGPGRGTGHLDLRGGHRGGGPLGRLDLQGHPAAPTSSPSAGVSAVASVRACSRSAMRSSTCSRPTDSRMRSGVTPVEACSSGSSCECVVEAGWMISDLASPTFASREKISTLSMSRRPASTPPLTPNVTIPPKPPVR